MNIDKYRNISLFLFILFLTVFILFSISYYYAYIVHNMNIILLKESISVEMKKVIFNENLDRVIIFLDSYRMK